MVIVIRVCEKTVYGLPVWRLPYVTDVGTVARTVNGLPVGPLPYASDEGDGVGCVVYR